MFIFRYFFSESMIFCFSHGSDQYGRVLTPIHGLFLRPEIYSCLNIHNLSILFDKYFLAATNRILLIN